MEGRNGSEWKILTAGFTRGNMMDSYEYCMIWTQEGDHPGGHGPVDYL